jgi:hypothetical protein
VGCIARASKLAPAIALLLVVGLIASAGFSAGFHRRVPVNEWGRFVFTLSSAITAVVYGIGGYVSFEPVEGALKARGLTSDGKILSEIGGTFPENFSDEKLITSAIQHASSLAVPIPPPALQNEKYNVRPAGGDDLGFIALATLAFLLFSHSMTAIYVCYLLILAMSVFLFWLAFRHEPAYLAVLLLTCTVIYALFISPLFTGLHGGAWESPLSAHFLSTLAFVPLLHILAVHCRCLKLTLGQILCLVAQVAILYFAIRLRASAVWTVGPIFLAVFLVCLRSTRRCRLEPSMRTRVQMCTRQCWPALVFLLTALCAHIAFEAQLHPVYRQGNNLTRHAFWPEVFYGLTSHPQWADKFGSMYLVRGEVAVQDQLPVAAVLRYLDLHPEIDRSQLLDRAGNLYWGAIEHYSMLALWDFVRTEPRFVVESFGYKLNGLLSILKAMPEWVFGSFSVPTILILALLVICAACFLAAASVEEKGSFNSYLLLLALCVPASWLPNIVALVGWELMADAIVSSFLFLSVLLALVASTMGKSMLHLLRSRMEAHRMRAPTAAAGTGVPAVVRLVVDKEEVASDVSQPVERVGAATRRRAAQAQAR